VKPAETLSGIALQYLRDGVTMNQMMVALFQSNPQAFGNNINMLREGAILNIPDDNELHRHAPETATVEVVRQTNTWQIAHQQRNRIEISLSIEEYGPVQSGETLSGIAARVLHDDTTMNQMMIALFASNPEAFDNNINRLHAGAILRIPEKNEVYRLTPETATAEVVRQTKAWPRGSEQHARLALTHAEILASNDRLIN
jgi:FimV-like protein